MNVQQLQLPLVSRAVHPMTPGRYAQSTEAAVEIALALEARLDGVTMDELRQECIAVGIKPSPGHWWGTVLRQRFVQTHEIRDHLNVWRLA